MTVVIVISIAVVSYVNGLVIGYLIANNQKKGTPKKKIPKKSS